MMDLMADLGGWMGKSAAGYLTHPLSYPLTLLPAFGANLLFSKGVSRERALSSFKITTVLLLSMALFASVKGRAAYRAYKAGSYWGGQIAQVYGWFSFFQPFLDGIGHGLVVNGVWNLAAWRLKPWIDPMVQQFGQQAARALVLEVGKQSLFLGALSTCDALALSELLLKQSEAPAWRRRTTLSLALLWIAFSAQGDFIN